MAQDMSSSADMVNIGYIRWRLIGHMICLMETSWIQDMQNRDKLDTGYIRLGHSG